jgi:hypothetical protein
MNLKALTPLTADGTDQPVEVPRGYCLAFHPIGAAVELRDTAGSIKKGTFPADRWVTLGESLDQTVYLRAVAGTVIELLLT